MTKIAKKQSFLAIKVVITQKSQSCAFFFFAKHVLLTYAQLLNPHCGVGKWWGRWTKTTFTVFCLVDFAINLAYLWPCPKYRYGNVEIFEKKILTIPPSVYDI